MKLLITLLTFTSMAHAWAGGGMTPIVTLTCEDQTRVRVDEWISEERHSPSIGLQFPGDSKERTLRVRVLRQQNNLRVFEFLAPHPYGLTSLEEISQSNWNLVRFGGQWIVNCRK